MADQLQLRGGNTAENSTFTGALREVTVDTDKDVLVVHDGVAAGGHPLMAEDGSNSALSLGSAASPALKFTGDTNTGIYSPGADQLAISTNGTGRLFVDASGRVGIGGSPAQELHVYSATDSTLRLQSTSDNRELNIACGHTGFDADQIIGQSASLRLTANGYENLRLGGSSIIGYTSGSERLRITSDGKVGVGTTSPTEALEVAGNAILDASNANLKIKAGGAGTVGAVNFTFNTDSTVYGGIDLAYDNRSTDGVRLYSGGNGYPVTLQAENSSVRFATQISGVQYERARIDSSGRLLVGTSTSSTIDTLVLQGNSGFTTGDPILRLRRNNAAIFSSTSLAQITFENQGNIGASIEASGDGTWATGDYPGRLMFSTTADGASSPTERMRIKSTGIVNVGTTPVYADNAAAKAGGLVNGDIYRKSDGTLMIVYT